MSPDSIAGLRRAVMLLASAHAADVSAQASSAVSALDAAAATLSGIDDRAAAAAASSAQAAASTLGSVSGNHAAAFTAAAAAAAQRWSR